MEVLKENKAINDNNIKKFISCFIYHNKGLQCCLCGKNTDVGGSYSNKGDRLICNTCFHTKFKNIEIARNWIARREEEINK